MTSYVYCTVALKTVRAYSMDMLVYRAFRYRIYPTPEQKKRLEAWEGAARFLWNAALAQYKYSLSSSHRRWPNEGDADAKNWTSTGKRRVPTAFGQGPELTELRKELPWLADVPRHALAIVLDDLEKAWNRCFQRLAKQPKFKCKGRDAVSIGESEGKRFRIDGDTLVMNKKLGPIRIKVHRPLQGTQNQCRLVREGDRWFAAISCEWEIADPKPSTKPAVGIDRGVVNVIADSNGHIEPNPRFFEENRIRVARAQRCVTRHKKRGSSNQKKARTRVARLERKARRQREAVLHLWSKNYAQNHGTVFVEDLNIRNMTSSAKGTIEEPGTNVKQKSGLNRAILDSGWGKFAQMLEYKLQPLGGKVVKVPAAYSSQTCAQCGVVDAASRKSQSEFQCVACDHRDHADVNAAKVIYIRGTRGDAVCGGVPIAGPIKQKRRPARVRTHTRKRTIFSWAPGQVQGVLPL